MYKMVLLLKHSHDKGAIQSFQDTIFRKLSSVAKGKVQIAKVDGGILSEEQYVMMLEAEFSTQNEMIKAMQTTEGIELNKIIAGLSKYITVLFFSYSEDHK